MKVYYGSIHSAFNVMLILCRQENISKMFGQPNRRQKNMLIKFPMKIESQDDPKVLKVTTLVTIQTSLTLADVNLCKLTKQHVGAARRNSLV